jgi:hypothetical protein
LISKEEILARGYVDVKVFVAGLRQSHRLNVVREQTSRGMIPFLMSQYYIPTPELVRLAETLQLPLKHKDVVVFPRGKMAGHFMEKSEAKEAIVTVEPETVEAEVE